MDLIAAEDTRHTLKLLNHLNISKPLISYYKQIEKTKSKNLLEKLLNGQNIALVSDAGTPGISDPGEEIIKEAINNNIEVVPIPGACAAINGLIASGLSTKEFIFIGFLPVNKKEKIEKLEEIKLYNQTIIFYEAPHKLINTLIVLEGSNTNIKEEKINALNELTLEEHYKYYEKLKIKKKEIIKKIAKDRNTNKNEIYQYFLNK